MTRVRFPEGARIFSLCHHVQTSSGAHPDSYPMDIWDSLAVKQPDHETDPSSPSSAKVKNMWSHTSTSQFILMAWCLI